jgi:hypothetical protein
MKAKRLYIYNICIISGPDILAYEGRRQRRLAASRIEEYHLKRLRVSKVKLVVLMDKGRKE